MKLLKWLDNYAELAFMGICLAAITLIMFLQVVMRYVFKNALPWPEESCRYIFIWLSYIGISYSIKENSLMKVDIVHTLCPKVAPYLNVLGDISIFIFCILMIKPGFAQVQKVMSMNTVSAAMSFPMWVVFLSLLVGVILGALRMIQRYYLFFKNKKNPQPAAEKEEKK